ncbi:hypothetical protein, partial [Heyndrickxia ginsengihumi]|uniref:hypothetical protein n=1 Tax=Heyndrickxia ginsengihumi TaxID=363870 RepID=UPI003D20D569
ASKIVQLMQKHGYNPGWQAEIFTVSKVSPLTFKASTDDIELDPDDYYLNADLSDFRIGDKALILFNCDSITGESFVVMKVK